jgi:hypothetical protein
MTKRIRVSVAALVVGLVLAISCSVLAGAQIRTETKTVYYRPALKIIVDGHQTTLDVEPFIVDPGWIMVSAEFISKELGATVVWDDVSSTFTIGTKGSIAQALLQSQLATAPAAAKAASKSTVILEPTQAQIDEAVKIGVELYGGKVSSGNWAAYIKHWSTGPYKMTATITTAYYAYMSQGFKLKTSAADIETIHRLMDGRIGVVAKVLVDEINSAKSCRGVLMQGLNTIPPEVEAKDTFADHSENWPNKPAYEAVISFWFDINKIDLNNPLVDFVLILPDGTRAGVIFDLSLIK